MNEDNLISIIVPVFNAEKYVEKCIESIRAQTYKRLEIILIDDGSSDDSGSICDKYAKIDDRIKVIHTENGGTSAATNKGLDVATGEYIGFVDNDDFINEDMYSLMIRSAIVDEADIVQIGYNYVNESGNLIRTEKRYKRSYYNFYEMVNAYLIEKEINGVVFNKLFHKSLRKDIRMVEGHINEDSMVILRVMKVAQKVVVMAEIGYNYVLSKHSQDRGPYYIRHLERCLYEPDCYYKFLVENVKELADYGIALKCKRSMMG